MITLLLGGARSGKSAFAERMALSDGEVTYLATADAKDSEMAHRIAEHRRRRPASWSTWEGDAADLPGAVSSMRGTLLLDCLTLFLTRLFLSSGASESEDEAVWASAEREILSSVEALFVNFSASRREKEPSHLIVVSNEVGLGLVPPYRMGRRFRDMQGRANRMAAERADRVALLVAGLPLWLKGGSGA